MGDLLTVWERYPAQRREDSLLPSESARFRRILAPYKVFGKWDKRNAFADSKGITSDLHSTRIIELRRD
jgi:hypothetical protein